MSDVAQRLLEEMISLPPRSAFAGGRGAVGVARAAQPYARFFPESGRQWSDALVSRTRRHVGGVTGGVERLVRSALRQHLAGEVIGMIPDALCWNAIAHHPDRISPALFAHFRTRAGLCLMSDLHWPDDGAPHAIMAPDILAEMESLRPALGAWQAKGDDAAPMPVDLPAEYVQELVWTCCALMADFLVRAEAVPVGTMLQVCDEVGQQVLLSYDEETGPLARAALLARRFRELDLDRLTIQLVQEGEHLLLCAMIADRCGLDVARVAEAIIHGSQPETAHALCRAAGLNGQVCGVILLALRQVRDCPSDEHVGMLVDAYDALPEEVAQERFAGLAMSEGLREAVARVGMGRAC